MDMIDDKLVRRIVKCPKCLSKASYFSGKIERYRKLLPSQDGRVVCLNCGFNKEHHFTSKDYYYAFQVKDRKLYARGLDSLKTILNHFKSDKHYSSDPECDFPKEFYVHKRLIIHKIEKILIEED